jgi:hypothetical protein
MIVVLLVGLLVTGLSAGLAVSSHAERQIAGTHQRTLQLSYDTESVAAEVEAALVAAPEWSAMPATWVLGPPVVPPGWDERTAALNRSLTARMPAGADTPRWRLAGARPEEGVAVWLRDDPADGDGNSALDANGRITVRIERVIGLERRGLEVTWQKAGMQVRRVSWRED